LVFFYLKLYLNQIKLKKQTQRQGMNQDKKWDILFIEDVKSALNADTQIFTRLFKNTVKAYEREEVLKLLENHHYDIIIHDMSVDYIKSFELSKQLKEMKPAQEIVALVSLSDEDKLSESIDLGIHSFLLDATQFEQALEAIAQMDLNENK
jgi:DNA-binding NarL/FixJ family response regulator